MPTPNYSIQVTCVENNGNTINASYKDPSATGFSVVVANENGTSIDKQFSFTVNATNATLPSTITDEEAQSILDYISTGRMSGEVTMWSGSTVPSGWLECNGQSTSGYTALAAVVGATVPDLRGEFVRGWDNGKGTDSGRALLSSQSDEFGAHDHGVGSTATGVSGVYGNYAGGGNTVNSSTEGGSETRPRNIALMYIIKT
jgi:hypothetical protein